MNIPITKKRGYNVPKGNHPVKVVDCYPVKTNADCARAWKLVLAPLKLETKTWQQTAAKTYCIDAPNDELTDDLITIMGTEFEDHILDNGSFDTGALIGRHVDAVVEHVQGDRYEKPFTFVSRIYPAGTLVKEDKRDQPPHTSSS